MSDESTKHPSPKGDASSAVERVVFRYDQAVPASAEAPDGRSVRHDIELEGPAGDHLLQQIRRTGGFYEGDLLRTLDRAARDRGGFDLVVDVGANLGNHAVFFGRVIGARVLCVEASPLAIPFLTGNLERNGLADRSEVVHAAAARNRGHLFVNDPKVGNLGMMRTELFPRGESSHQVPAEPIDRIVRVSELARDRRVDLIKIDVEGFEEEVLAGAEWIIRNHMPILVIELANERAFERVATLLRARGYSVSGPFAHTPVYVFTKDQLGDNAAVLHQLVAEVGQIRNQLTLLQSHVERGARVEKEAKASEARLQELQRSVREVHDSARYRIGDAMVSAMRPSRDTLRLPGRLYSIYKESKKRLAPIGGVKTATMGRREVRQRHAVFHQEFERFLDDVRKARPRHLVVMYSGTTFIQDIRANRPIRLARAMVEEHEAVLFNFHRWRETEHIPEYETSLLFQSPIDLTPDLVRRLCAETFEHVHPVLVVSYPHPSVTRLINLANVAGWSTLYDCRDDWEEFEKVGAAKWYRESVERFVVNNCDLSFCVSRPLQKKMQAFTRTREVRLSPNAYDPSFLSRSYRRRPVQPPKIGYFGHLTERWFDWESLRWIAEQRPGYQFEIIGHGAPKGLVVPSNVRLLGPRRHAEICELAAEWSVGIIPFRTGPLADGVDPIKIYEYFGLGLPVVSFRMPQISDYPCTQTVESRQEFVTALDRAAETPCDTSELERFLADNTWHGRAQEILAWADESRGRRDVVKSFHALASLTGSP